MDRDMDLIRRIALETAGLPIGQQLSGLEGVAEDVFALHVAWMDEAGLIKAYLSTGLSAGKHAVVFRLTWDGCEFVDAVRSDTMWRKAKENVIKPGMSFTFGILKEWVKTEITQGLPTLRGSA